MNATQIAKVAKGMLEETSDEYVSMGIVLLAAKLCYPEAYDYDRERAVDWMLDVLENIYLD